MEIIHLDSYGNRYFSQEAMEKLFDYSVAAMEINSKFKPLRESKSIAEYCSIIVEEQIAAGLDAAIIVLEESEASANKLVEDIKKCRFKVKARILIFTESGMIDLVFKKS